MITLSSPVADTARAVASYKHELLVKVMTAIVKKGLEHTYVFPGDLPEDIVEMEHRQGVTSNAWNTLRSLEIIEPLPPSFNNESLQIFGGRKQNKNPSAKLRWNIVYRLSNPSAAYAWARANNISLDKPDTKPAIQTELILV